MRCEYRAPDRETLARTAERLRVLMEEGQAREANGQALSLEVDARFKLQGLGAEQFQVARLILEGLCGLDEREVMAEIVARGMAAVLGEFSDFVEADEPEAVRPAASHLN